MITERQEYAARLFEEYGTKAEVARQMGISESSVRRLLKNYDKNVEESEVPEIEYNTSQIPDPIYFDAPKKGVKRFLLCAAQSHTKLHEPFWENILAYKEYLGAELLVSTFYYVKEGFGVKGAKHTLNSEKNDTYGTYFPAIRDYIVEQPVHIGDGLIFCAEMNTLPTAKNPLSGFEAYTKDKWGIFPHPKVHLKSIATAQDKPAKQIMTTAAITNPNYVIKRAGIEAHFHHQIGAVIVELAADGSFWCRHLLARDDDGSFYDLDLLIQNGEVTHGHDVLAINWGDIHIEKIDPSVARHCWNYAGSEMFYADKIRTVVDVLKPEMQFIHDLVDFSARNHHNISDPHFIYQTHLQGTNSVKNNLLDAVEFLRAISETSEMIKVVISNHDNALVKWLKNPHYDFRIDPINSVFYLETQLEYYKAIENAETRTFYEDTLNRLKTIPSNVSFIHEDTSFIQLGIEFGMHGHLGANGGKGSTRTFTKMGYKSNTGHTHTPEIFDGAYVAGTSSLLDMGYNKGLSSWSHSHIVTYRNGARTIITAGKNGKFFADQ